VVGSDAAGTGVTPSLLWELTRASGFTCLALLCLAAILGYRVRRRPDRRSPPSGLGGRERFELHAFIAWSACAALGVHLVTLLLDPYVRFTPADVLLPFRSTYAPVGTAAGVLALWGLVATVGAGLGRRLLGYPAWLRVHRFSDAVLALAVVHVLLTGTDRRSLVAWAVCGTAALLVLYRVLHPAPAAPPPRAIRGGPPPGL
jgi:predicted ferric reductase